MEASRVRRHQVRVLQPSRRQQAVSTFAIEHVHHFGTTPSPATPAALREVATTPARKASVHKRIQGHINRR
jgi:hypothetical protein